MGGIKDRDAPEAPGRQTFAAWYALEPIGGTPLGC